jgi:hypothetical protein
VTAHVVDANVVNRFQQERLLENPDTASAAIDLVMSKGYIILDVEGHCQAEWMGCAEGAPPLALSDWIADRLVDQDIRLANLCSDSMFKILSGLGLPKKDHKWVRLAIGGQAPVLLADDIDFFDPTQKGKSAAITKKVRSSGRGPMAKYLKKEHGITPMCPEHYLAA